MNYYVGRPAYRYPSQIDDDEDFRSAEQARAFDGDLALGLVLQMVQAPFEAALQARDERLVKALRWLAEEIESAAYAIPKPETT